MNKYLLVFFYFLAVALLFYPVIFQDNTFGSGDTLNPYAINHILDIYKNKIGEWPLWQPWIFSGMPTIEAFTYINQLYIPTRILIGIGFSDIGIQLIHLIFSAIGMYLLFRQFKIDSLISFSISLLWMLNPYLITMIVFGHGSQMMTAAYIPWIIYAINNLYKNTSLRSLAILSLLIGLQLQRGHIQIAYYSWMLFGAYFLFYNCYYIKNKSLNYKYVIYFLIACIVGFLLSSHIYYPSLEYLPESIRSGGIAHYDYATNWSLHPKELLTYIFPYYYGFGGENYTGFMPFTDYPNYVGFFVLLFALLSFLKPNNHKLFFGSILILSLFLSFGKYFSFVFDLFYNFFPFFDKFRVPSMILIITNFSIYVLAAFGISEITRRLIPKNFNPKIFIYIFMFISLVDIYRIDRNIISPTKDSNQKSQIISNEKLNSFFEEDEVIDFLKNDSSLYRIYPVGRIFQDPKLKFYGIHSVGGYHPAKFRHYNNLLNNSNNLLSFPVLRFLNVKYLLSPFELSHDMIELVDTKLYKSVMGKMDLKIYMIKNNLDRAWFVKRTIEQDDRIYDYLTSDSFYPEDVAVVKGLESQKFVKGTILNIEWDIHEITIDVETTGRSFLVLSEIYYPQKWKLTIDGELSDTFQANGVLRGAILDSGRHTVKFKYESKSFQYLKFLSNSIIIVIFFLLVIPLAMRLLKDNS
jgi:hypothetical protein